MPRHPELESVLKSAQEYDENVLRLAKRFGYLPYMVRRYIEILGSDGALELLRANEEPLPEYLRCNDYLISCDALARRLEGKGVRLRHEPKFSPLAYRILESPVAPGALHEHLLGYYYLQGPASMSVVHALEPEQGNRALDMAAAPGGKATQILQLARDQALLVAVEKNRRRIRSLRANMQRMRFTRYILLRTDSRFLPMKSVFDKVLLDAPSTGEGIIRKDPSRRRSRTPRDLAIIHELQVEMLLKAIDYAKRGAHIVYAACTLAPEEGEMVIDAVLRAAEERVDVERLPIKYPSPGVTRYFGVSLDPRVRYCGRFWPHIHGSEGFFLCRLVKLRD
ncbi:MAG: RsmB/NOP family class I SAM-dependent RNA methyltransferase [Desulfurococcales archaeon]|nr:RsmB/NOP family class I SAM-dependent RNA methyltransferase [Desulfurococcales archaeon]